MDSDPGTQLQDTEVRSRARLAEHLAADAVRPKSSPAFWQDPSCVWCIEARSKVLTEQGLGDEHQGDDNG